MEIVIFSAGLKGKEAFRYYKRKGYDIKYFIDNNEKLWGSKIYETEIISIQHYMNQKMNYEIVVGGSYKVQYAIEKQLEELGIHNYVKYKSTYELDRLFSRCSPNEKEDVILYHLFKQENEVFFIDVGSNDPIFFNVTKLLAEKKNAHGINIEPQQDLFELTCKERSNDINLQIGLGKEDTELTLYLQDGGSTLNIQNVLDKSCETSTIKITTLKKVCQKYLSNQQKISLLKIDVEGAEKDVLLGADFQQYRPEIICIESTIPRTMIPCYEEWEGILLDANYKYVCSYGVNRYYVAEEVYEKYITSFQELDKLDSIYDIYYMKYNI